MDDRIAVITPYHGETAIQLDRCIRSVQAQTHPVTHILVGDGANHTAREAVSRYRNVLHYHLPLAHRDFGDTPRFLGAVSAYQHGYDGICWLDADCWLEPMHVKTLFNLARDERVNIVTATRRLFRPDGTLMGTCHESNGDDFCDTNCYLVMRDVMPQVSSAWAFKEKPEMAVIGDRYVWEKAKTFPRHHVPYPTVNYETLVAAHYVQRGEEPPEGARIIYRKEGEDHFASVLYRDFVRQHGTL